MEKFEIKDIKTPALIAFFEDSYMHGDQTLDITKEKFYCKASNTSMSDIIYREMFLDSDAKVSAKAPDHVKFFLQNYKMLHSVAKAMSSEKTIDIVVHYSGDVVSKLTFKNSYINYDIFNSDIQLARYIEDSSFLSVKYPKTVISQMILPASKIKEIKSMHSLTKSDNEKMNLVFIYQKLNKLILKHESNRGEWEIEFDSENLISDSTVYALNLEIFTRIGSYSDFALKIADLPNGSKACYLVTNNTPEMINISRIEKKE